MKTFIPIITILLAGVSTAASPAKPDAWQDTANCIRDNGYCCGELLLKGWWEGRSAEATESERTRVASEVHWLGTLVRYVSVFIGQH